MDTVYLIRVLVALLPVLIFLAALVYLDSYKLVRFRTVMWVIGAGASLPVAAYVLHEMLLRHMNMDFLTFTRYVSPFTEETLKALLVIYLFRSHRIGFLVDSAILGFAVGAGYAVVENLYYVSSAGDTGIVTWIVRGFGTAIMHGGVTAMFAILSQTLTERNMNVNPLRYLPGLGTAVALHSLFNHFVLPPILMTVSILAVLPLVLYVVFVRSTLHMQEWLELDFDADALLLQQINSGEFSQSKIGRYLEDLRSRFDGEVVVDMLCYLRLYTELALRAKGLLMMRQNGLDISVGERTRDKFAELAWLEQSIGKTGILAVRPFLHMTRKDLWQLYVLEK